MRSPRGGSAPWPWKWTPPPAPSSPCRCFQFQRCRLGNRHPRAVSRASQETSVWRDAFQGPGFWSEPRPKPSCFAVLRNWVSYRRLWQSKRRRLDAALDLANKAEGTHDEVLGVCTGRRMAQPETDRLPLRLRAMPPGRLRRKRRHPHHAGCHDNRAGPYGRVRRLRGAVVGGTGWPPFFHWEDPSLAGNGLVEQAEEGSSSL